MSYDHFPIYQAFCNDTDIIIIILSPDSKILEFNKQAEKLYSWRKENVLNQDYFQLLRDNQLELPCDQLNEVIKNSNGIKSITKIINNSNVFVISWTITPVLTNHAINYFLFSGINITNYWQSPNQKNITNYLETIIHHVPHTIFWKDKNSVFLGCNNAFAKGAGLNSPREIVGKTDYDLPWAKEESDAYVADDREVMASRKHKLNIEETQTLPNGKKIVLLTSKVPLFDEEGDTTGVLGIYTDITERKQKEVELKQAKEKAELANQIKAEFIANMSHDIRTPLAGVLGMSEVILHNTQEKKTKEYAQDILSASQRLLQLLNEILEITQIDLDHNKQETRVFNLQNLTKSINELLIPSFVKKSLIYNLDYENNISPHLVSNPILIHRILLNLLGNALKFTERGSISVTIKQISKVDQNVTIQFIIKDTGIGISEDRVKILFEPFSRLNPSYEGKYHGTGLGLYIVKQFIEELDGKLTVQSTVDQGTTFTVTIPMKIADPNDITQNGIYDPSEAILSNTIENNFSLEKNHVDKNNEKYIRVLLVEDDYFSAKVAALQLNQLGCAIDTVTTGQAAFTQFGITQYDLVYMDIGLPDMDGIEVTKQIRAIEKAKGLKPTKIIALTAHLSKSLTNTCHEAGIDGIVNKPLTIQTAQMHIQKYVAIKTNPFSSSEDVKESTSGKKQRYNKIIQELREMFIKGLPTDLKQIDQAYQNGDWDNLQSLVHKLRGALLYCNVEQAKKSTHNLEKALQNKARDIENIANLYQLFKLELTNLLDTRCLTSV